MKRAEYTGAAVLENCNMVSNGGAEFPETLVQGILTKAPVQIKFTGSERRRESSMKP